MLKNILAITTASMAIALAAASSLPASANSDPLFTPDPPVQSVPEPTTVFGVIAFAGGSLFAKKRADSKNAE